MRAGVRVGKQAWRFSAAAQGGYMGWGTGAGSGTGPPQLLESALESSFAVMSTIGMTRS